MSRNDAREICLQPLLRDNIRLAATVMLVRDSAAGLEVYMVKRPGRGDFPDLHVFPGGKVDEGDFAPDICAGLDDLAASERMGLPVGGLRYWVAVARECFEECGVLLVQQDGNFPDFSRREVVDRYHNYRERLLADELTFGDICRAEGLTVACDRLDYFSHWITPKVAPRRFDTRFFVAVMPDHQQTLAHTSETADDQWESPQQALARHAEGEWQMIDPTLRSLESLARYANVRAAMEGIRQVGHLPELTDHLRRQGMQPYA